MLASPKSILLGESVKAAGARTRAFNSILTEAAGSCTLWIISSSWYAPAMHGLNLNPISRFLYAGMIPSFPSKKCMSPDWIDPVVLIEYLCKEKRAIRGWRDWMGVG